MGTTAWGAISNVSRVNYVLHKHPNKPMSTVEIAELIIFHFPAVWASKASNYRTKEDALKQVSFEISSHFTKKEVSGKIIRHAYRRPYKYELVI